MPDTADMLGLLKIWSIPTVSSPAILRRVVLRSYLTELTDGHLSLYVLVENLAATSIEPGPAPPTPPR